MSELLARLTLPLAFLWMTSPIAFSQGDNPTLEEVKAAGAQISDYAKETVSKKQAQTAPKANLAEFKSDILPLLRDACFQCHGPSEQEGDFRVDTLNPDLLRGDDTAWWIEIFDVLSNGEMPPADEGELTADGRRQIIDWLSSELKVASQVARSEQGHSSFRRMTRYEYNYAVQDLLGLPYDFADDLPPESKSADGFLNSSEMLQISVAQLQTYRRIARQALLKATVSGEPPMPIHYALTMDFGVEKAKRQFENDLEKLRKRFADDPDRLETEIAKRKKNSPRGTHYRNLETGFAAAARWRYSGARFARNPVSALPETPKPLPDVAVIPANQKLILDLGDHLPDTGSLHMRLRASVDADHADGAAALRVFFGHQASNNSAANERVRESDITISAANPNPKFYEFDIPLSEVVRNPFRGIQKLGQTPNPAEYVMLQNVSDASVDIKIDYVEITAPHFATWPPPSHRRIFIESANRADESKYAREVIEAFMSRAWRRPPSKSELDQKIRLYDQLRPQCDHSEEAIVEVLAGVLSSPKFLYLSRPDAEEDQFQLATRLAMFLWSSLPDQKLMDLAQGNELSDPEVLSDQVERMLADPRAERFPKRFVNQWLGMELLDHLETDESLLEAMKEEPVAFFGEVLRENSSVMDFLHADYAMVNGPLARHYGLTGISGNGFRRVSLPAGTHRGGLLTQAGLLAMNSDGNDSHPLKRGIWLLECILNDPPPPPPPAVPEIDLSDPDILKLTLKERMEDHRNDPACMSCHQRIDPWGIAFENYDALGRWRTQVSGKPVDATSMLINKQQLRGADGLKRFLLTNRQDQFARAMTHKLVTYALGRPLSFADRGEVDRITGELRRSGDGLRSLIKLIVISDLFRAGSS